MEALLERYRLTEFGAHVEVSAIQRFEAEVVCRSAAAVVTFHGAL
jgi:hypothetical protein